MAQDPLALLPASTSATTSITATATSTSVPGTLQSQPSQPSPAPTKDFKKIVLRQTARKFTARPPPPRRPWPKPNYYCNYDSHESITSSLFSSDVVFSKSVVESLFFNIRYNKDSNISPPTGPVEGPNAVRVTTLKYGQRKNVTEDDDDIQFIAHIKPNLQSQSQSQSHLNGLSPAATNGQAKGLKRVKPRCRPKSKSSIKNDKSKEIKDPLSLHQTNTDTPKSSKSIKAGSKVRTSISLIKVPPKKKQRLTLSNKEPVINGLGPEPGPAKEKAIAFARKSAPSALLPPQQPEPEIDAGVRPSTSFPTHLWSLPTLAWTQATNSTTASSSNTQSPSAPAPVSAANSVTPSRIVINGQPAAKKRALSSPSTTRTSTCTAFKPNSSTEKKLIKANGAQIRLVKQSPKRAIDARLACPSPILEAIQAKIPIPIIESKIKKANTNGLGSATKIVKNGININSLLRVVGESTEHKSGKQNDKNNNACGPPISKAKPDQIQGVPVPVLNKRISGHSGVQKPKQTKINGMFKLAKKNPNASTANQKSKAPSHSIVRNQGHTLSNGPRPKTQELNSNGASRDEIKTAIPIKSPITANSTIPNPLCNIKVVPKSPRTSPAKPKSHLPEFEDTCILVVPRPMTNEAPIDYSLKKMPPREPSPDIETLTEPLNLKSTRQLRTTPTKSYAHLTKRSCPCDCSAPH